jgi:hypothetical protein
MDSSITLGKIMDLGVKTGREGLVKARTFGSDYSYTTTLNVPPPSYQKSTGKA